MIARPLLLLDLDGVLVVETDLPRGAREILSLHAGTGAALAAARQPACILTHRSRPEALQLLRAAGIGKTDLLALFAAEDLLFALCRSLRIRQLWRSGLTKDLALRLAETASGEERDSMVAIDDRQHNLDALLEAGLGLALKAPSGRSADGRSLITFDLVETLRRLPAWHGRRSEARQVDLAPVERPVEAWQQSGLSTGHLDGSLFNRSRRLVAHVRRTWKRAPRSARGGAAWGVAPPVTDNGGAGPRD